MKMKVMRTEDNKPMNVKKKKEESIRVQILRKKENINMKRS